MDRRLSAAIAAVRANTPLIATGFAAAAGGIMAGPIGAVAGGLAAPFVMRWTTRGGPWSALLNRTKFDYSNIDPTKNSIVMAVVGWIARNFPEAPVRVGRLLPDRTIEWIARGPVGPGFMLKLLERPNRWMSGVLMWMAVIVDLYCTGNAFILKIRNASGRVVELWYAPRKTMKVCWPADDPTVYIGWYEYRPGDGYVYFIRPEDVVHLRDGIDPDNPRLGLSKLASLFREIFTDDEAANFSASLLRNLGVPGVVISPSNTTASFARIADPDQVKRKFAETFGGDHRGEPMVMSMATDIKVISFNPQEMDLKLLRRVPEERISGVLGIAAVVAGLGAGLERSTFTNYGEARKAAYEESVIPEQRLISAELLVQLLPEWADIEATEYVVDFDVSKVRALQEAVDAIWNRNLRAMSAGGITRASFKRATGQPVAADGSDEVYVLPNNFMTVPVGGQFPPTGRPSAPPTPSTTAAEATEETGAAA